MIFDENKIIAQAYMSMLGEKKMDPVGKEDGDIDNDGDKDKSDAYLHARRKAISTSVKKEGIDIEMPKKSSMGKELEKDEDEMDGEDDEDDVKSKSMKVKNKTTDKENGQVNELSNDTLTRYSNSARGQARHSMAKLGGATSKGEVDKLSSTMTKRLKGNAVASRKMNTESVEELDELSIKKLLTYRSKATEKLGSDPAKDAKRKAGIGASGMKVKAKLKNEEVESIDEISDKTKKTYVNAAALDAARLGNTLGRLQGIASTGSQKIIGDKITNRLTGIKRATSKMAEEVEELDELSKKTLGSYVKAAAKDAEQAGQDQEYHGHENDYARGRKRQRGISKAVDRLTKEEVELDEANAMQMASAIEAYAKKHGGIDKDDMMKVASMLKKGDMKGAVKYTKTLDTDPRDFLLSKMGMTEAFQDDDKMNWDAWKQKAKQHGAVKFVDTDNKTIAYDKNKKQVSSITWSSKKKGMAEASNPPFDMPYKKAEEPKKDKSGAVHSPMSRVKHLARQAMKNQMKEQHNIEITDYQADALIEAAGLQEISKATLGSYVKKAKTSAIGASQVAGMGRNIVGQKSVDKAEKKVQKRAKGINKAVDRLTKEDVDQIDELSKSTMRRYVNKSASDLAKTSMELGGSYAKGSGDSVSQNKMLDKMVSRKKGISKATERMAKESYEWDWNAIFEASDEEIDSLIEQLDGEELESFIEEFDSIDEGSYQSSTGSRQPMNANGQETLEPRAEADKAFSNAHKVVTAIADHPYKYNQHASQKPQATKRPGDERNSEPKKTLSDIRKR